MSVNIFVVAIGRMMHSARSLPTVDLQADCLYNPESTAALRQHHPDSVAPDTHTPADRHCSDRSRRQRNRRRLCYCPHHLEVLDNDLAHHHMPSHFVGRNLTHSADLAQVRKLPYLGRKLPQRRRNSLLHTPWFHRPHLCILLQTTYSRNRPGILDCTYW